MKDEALEKLGAIADEYIQAKQEFDKIVDEVFETDPEDFDAMDKKVQEAQERLEKAIGAINDFQNSTLLHGVHYCLPSCKVTCLR